MKTLFLKNRMPVATAILAIAGAFATTSMQNSSSIPTLKTGYTLDPATGACQIAASCTDSPSDVVCRISYPIGDQAYQLGPVVGTCSRVLYRPKYYCWT
jgi:hypothetical protein